MSFVQSAKSRVCGKIGSLLEKSKWLSHLLENFSCYIVRNDPSAGNYDYVFKTVKLLKKHQIDVVLDVGACNGRYAFELRKMGYKQKLISFEPTQESFNYLVKLAKGDSLWSYHKLALGDQKETKPIKVLKEGPASSFLKTSNLHKEVNPLAYVTHEENVQIARLDELYPQLCKPSDRVFLKIDTQGYEKQVLIGAGACLKEVSLIQVEASLKPLYENEPMLPELFSFMAEQSFAPIAINPISFDQNTGEFLQIDLMFANQLNKAL